MGEFIVLTIYNDLLCIILLQKNFQCLIFMFNERERESISVYLWQTRRERGPAAVLFLS